MDDWMAPCPFCCHVLFTVAPFFVVDSGGSSRAGQIIALLDVLIILLDACIQIAL